MIVPELVFLFVQVMGQGQMESRTSQGLVQGHAYSVIGLAEVR